MNEEKSTEEASKETRSEFEVVIEGRTGAKDRNLFYPENIDTLIAQLRFTLTLE